MWLAETESTNASTVVMVLGVLLLGVLLLVVAQLPDTSRSRGRILRVLKIALLMLFGC